MDINKLVANTIVIAVGIPFILLSIPYVFIFADWIASYGNIGLSIGIGFCVATIYFVINVLKEMINNE